MGKETVPRRAFKDTTTWLSRHPASYFLAFIIPGGGTVIAVCFVPTNVDAVKVALYGFLGGIGGLIVLWGGLYLLNLIMAPKRQRD